MDEGRKTGRQHLIDCKIFNPTIPKSGFAAIIRHSYNGAVKL